MHWQRRKRTTLQSFVSYTKRKEKKRNVEIFDCISKIQRIEHLLGGEKFQSAHTEISGFFDQVEYEVGTTHYIVY